MRRILLLAALSLASSTAFAFTPQIEVVRPSSAAEGALVYFSGPVSKGLANSLGAKLKLNKITNGTVVLNANGNDLETAMWLGRELRKLGLSTMVGVVNPKSGEVTPGACEDACLLALAGGVLRSQHPGSKVSAGPELVTQEGQDQEAVAAKVTAYLREMGVSGEFAGVLKAAGAGVKAIPEDQARGLSLLTAAR